MNRQIGIAVLFMILGAASHTTAATFSTAVKCIVDEENESKEWCLTGRYPEGQTVAFLGRRACRAKTGKQHDVSDLIGMGQGTELVDISCSDPKSGDTVVLNTEIKNYRRLLVVKNATAPTGLDLRVRSTDKFKAGAAQLERKSRDVSQLVMRVFEIEQCGRRMRRFFVTYSADGELPFIVQGETIQPLDDVIGLCTALPTAFRLNNSDFLAVNECECGTDGCGIKYVELEK